MLRILIISIVILISGCSIAPTSQVNTLINMDYAGKDTDFILNEARAKGLICQRLGSYETDERLKPLTDGTLKEIEINDCFAESSGTFCVKRASSYVLSQYGKVLIIRGPEVLKRCVTD